MRGAIAAVRGTATAAAARADTESPAGGIQGNAAADECRSTARLRESTRLMRDEWEHPSRVGHKAFNLRRLERPTVQIALANVAAHRA